MVTRRISVPKPLAQGSLHDPNHSFTIKMNRILDHDHSELDTMLESAIAALVKGVLDEAFERLDVFWARLAVHIRAENIHLFPALIRAVKRSPQRVGTPSHDEILETIVQLRSDHDFFMSELTAAMKALRAARQKDCLATPRAAGLRKQLDQVSSRLAAHNALEETRAYRWIWAMLEPSEQKNLVDNIQLELRNLPARLKNQPATEFEETR